MSVNTKKAKTAAKYIACSTVREIRSWSFAPNAWETIGVKPVNIPPIPVDIATQMFEPMATPAKSTALYFPVIVTSKSSSYISLFA